jgi:hypothetical protein
MGRWNSTIAMNSQLSSKFTLSVHETVTVSGGSSGILPTPTDPEKDTLPNRPIH